MSKTYLKFFILLVVIGFVVIPGNFVFAACPNGQVERVNSRGGTYCVNASEAPPDRRGDGTSAIDLSSLNPVSIASAMIDSLVKFLANTLITISSFILIMCGLLFDFVIKFTIVEIAENFSASSGIGQSVNGAWTTLRDIANMFFIFILLWVAFKAMFELNFSGLSKQIINIILVALLINFSLFFTKVVIDSSNIVALGFYKSIAQQRDANLSIIGDGGLNMSAVFGGISAGYMNMLGVQNFYNAKILDSFAKSKVNMFLVGFIVSVFMLITSVIFLITAVMFIARFIILIFLMILSPLALIAIIVPGQNGKFEEWKNMLINQSFFAPIFFALTWVVFKLGEGLKIVMAANNATTGRVPTWADLFLRPDQMMILLLNYTLMIGFAIAALVVSKSMASKTKGFTEITNALGANKVAGAVGGVTFGGAAAMGRRTVGAAASRIAQSQRLSNWAGRSLIGQYVKQGTEKVAESSFELRQTKSVGQALQNVPGVGSFGTGKTGGYEETLKKQLAKKDKIATGLKGDAAKQAYAARQLSGLSSYARGGSAPGHIPSIFGTLGRANRITASKILNSQIEKLRTDLNSGNTELTRYQNILNSNGGTGVLNPTQQARYSTLTAPALGNPGGQAGSLADLQAQITNIQTQINTLGITNPSNPTRSGRPSRADEQNY